MFKKVILGLLSAVFLLSALVAQTGGAQTRVVDLANTTPILAEWKIIASVSGGSAGTWPIPPSHVPATVRLTSCSMKERDLYFSVEIDNNRELELQVPISMNSKLFDHRGTITFRELQIRLGTATNASDLTTFQIDPRFKEILLFGDPSVPGTIAVLAPGERLLLRLKSEMQSPDQQVAGLRARIGAFDETLSPSGDGFRKIGTWVPALSAVSEPACSESKSEVK